MFRLPALSPEPFRKQGMGMRTHGDPVRSLCAGYAAETEISARLTDMRTRVVKILTTLAQDTDTVFIFPVHDGSPDLSLALPEGLGSKFRYFHIIPSPPVCFIAYLLMKFCLSYVYASVQASLPFCIAAVCFIAFQP